MTLSAHEELLQLLASTGFTVHDGEVPANGVVSVMRRSALTVVSGRVSFVVLTARLPCA